MVIMIAALAQMTARQLGRRRQIERHIDTEAIDCKKAADYLNDRKKSGELHI
jgi:hypothetical protein